jgi:hypothetical protein
MDTVGFAVVAAGIVLFGLISRRLETSVVTGPILFTAFGLAIGDAGLGIADLNVSHGFIHGLAEVTLILVLEEADFPGAETIELVVIVTVGLSILLHGVTAAPAARWYGNLVRKTPDCHEMKSVSVAELPTRGR